MKVQPPYASYRRGITLRLATGLLIWGLSAGSYALGLIRWVSLVGVSVSVAFITVMALGFLLFLGEAIRSGRPIASILDRLFVLVGYAAIMYFLGGVEASYLVPVFVIFQIYYVVATNRGLPFLTATMSFACISAFVVLECTGVLPHLDPLPGNPPPVLTQAAILVATGFVLYVAAFMSAGTASLIERGWASLNE
ncbi:MAG TPA: hypothetical protein VFI08_01885, partial [Spirochaetia bacterium]|nr:hypothetical protein [Spirochaetia bacterium]